MIPFQNYHRHSHYSNIVVPDSVASNEDYAIRATELGHSILSGVEHAWQGRYIEGYELAKKYNLKFLFGTESYIVKDRLEKDSTNSHIILLAKNENGRKNINRILSEANLTGFYYRPRIDFDLLFSLPANDVWITSACISGLWLYEDADDLLLKINDYFKGNFFLEVQNHYVVDQQNLNNRILNLSNRYNIPIIFGCDSHYIHYDQSRDRDDYLLSKHIEYKEENDWYMDYPDGDTVLQRFKEQGTLSKAQINEAINNTNVFLDVEPYDSIVFEKVFKLPSLYPELTQEDKNTLLCNMIWDQWEIEKNNIPVSRHKHYEKEIKKELDVIVETGMADYFLIDKEVVSKGKENGGFITLTGRGSGPSFYICKLLGLTTLDRISAPIKLFPERFVTKERILEAQTFPDIDLNLGNPEVFAKAQSEILGKDHSYPMMAYGTMQPKAAWKLYARAKNVDFETANFVSEQIDNYEKDLKHIDEDEKQNISIYSYIDNNYQELYDESRKYQGIVSHGVIHPCAYLIFDRNIREEIGLIRIKENICSIMDGLWAENYKFLKNDLLKVSSVDLIFRVYKRIGIEPHPLNELIKLCEKDEKVWEVYRNAWTMGINQVEQTSTSGRIAKYAPTNISELSAFIAAVRPGFQSNYKQFEAREHFSYGIPSLDSLIQTEDFPQSYLIYQENSMQVLAYAGIPLFETYEIVKNIAKKRVEKVLKYKEQFIKGMTKKIIHSENRSQEEADKIANMTWKIIEDSSHYSFNACISGNTKLDKSTGISKIFNPTVQEMFMIKNDIEYAKKTGHLALYQKYRTYGYGSALSMYPDGRIRKNKIIDIYQSGIQNVYKIITKNGKSIICTSNHKFPTPVGEKYLSDLKIGDSLYIKGSYQKNNPKHGFTNGDYIPNFPKKGQQGFQNNEFGASVIFKKTREEKVKNKCCCDICGQEYIDGKNFELHHNDQNRTNNNLENLIWCCNSCHKKEHYKNNRIKMYEKGIPAEKDIIVDIEYIGKEMVYDIEMSDPAHNFVIDNGLITSNSHAYSMAGDSLYGAYLKSHYPLEFYETFLQLLLEDGNKDRMAQAKEEATRAYHIRFPSYQFGQDNRTIVADSQKQEITSSLNNIKGLGSIIGENLYVLGQREYKTFFEFLVYAEENSMISSKFELLIKINYFSQFGNNKKLLTFFQEFTKGKDKYSKSYSEKTKEKRLQILSDLWEKLPNERLPIWDQITSENEILGYLQATYPVDKKYVYVLSLDVRFAPRVLCYCLANGKISSLKVQKKIYDYNTFLGGDILYIQVFKEKPAVTFVDGKYVESETEKQWWIDSYRLVKPEEFDSVVI